MEVSGASFYGASLWQIAATGPLRCGQLLVLLLRFVIVDDHQSAGRPAWSADIRSRISIPPPASDLRSISRCIVETACALKRLFAIEWKDRHSPLCPFQRGIEPSSFMALASQGLGLHR